MGRLGGGSSPRLGGRRLRFAAAPCEGTTLARCFAARRAGRAARVWRGSWRPSSTAASGVPTSTCVLPPLPRRAVPKR
eukprot:8509242-Alexandrium_andersonii.AAC.1